MRAAACVFDLAASQIKQYKQAQGTDMGNITNAADGICSFKIQLQDKQIQDSDCASNHAFFIFE